MFIKYKEELLNSFQLNVVEIYKNPYLKEELR